MARLTKRLKSIKDKVQPGKVYAIDDAFEVLKSVSSVKFVESVDVAVNLGVDPRKSDQAVRGATVLPHGTGKSVRVAVFAQERMPRPPWRRERTSSAWMIWVPR